MSGIKKGIYEHFKGKRYEVIDVVRHSETQEEYVLYKALYCGQYPEGTLWVRPLSMFLETVVRDGIEKPRFKYLSTS